MRAVARHRIRPGCRAHLRGQVMKWPVRVPPGSSRCAGRLALSTRTLIADRNPLSGAQIRGLTDAAAEAGFTDIAMSSDHFYWATADDMTADAFVAYHRDRGL